MKNLFIFNTSLLLTSIITAIIALGYRCSISDFEKNLTVSLLIISHLIIHVFFALRYLNNSNKIIKLIIGVIIFSFTYLSIALSYNTGLIYKIHPLLFLILLLVINNLLWIIIKKYIIY